MSLAKVGTFFAVHKKIDVSRVTIRSSAAPLRLRKKQHAARLDVATVAAYPAKPIGQKPVPVRFGIGPGMYPDETFIAETLAAFPEAGIANQEESLALYCDGGYSILDVRTAVELEDEGKIGGAYSIPLINGTKKFNLETKEKEMVQTANPDFLTVVEMTFPDKSTPLLITCSDSRDRAIQALILLEDAGYTNLVGMKGGYNLLYATFDNKFRRRFVPECTTSWASDGSTGFHATVSGGFEKMDKGDEGYVGKDIYKWLNWSEAMQGVTPAAAPVPEPIAAPVPEFSAPAPEPFDAPVPEFSALAPEPLAAPVPEFSAPVPEPFAAPAPEPLATPVPDFFASSPEPFAAPVPEFSAAAPDPLAAPVPDFFASSPEPFAAPVPEFSAPVPEFSAPAPDPLATPVPDFFAPAAEPFAAPVPEFSTPIPEFSAPAPEPLVPVHAVPAHSADDAWNSW